MAGLTEGWGALASKGVQSTQRNMTHGSWRLGKCCLKSLPPEKCNLKKYWNSFFTICGCLTASLYIAPWRNRICFIRVQDKPRVCVCRCICLFLLCSQHDFSILKSLEDREMALDANYEDDFHSFSGKINIKFGGGAKCPRECDPLEKKSFQISLCLSCFVLLREINLEFLGVSLLYYSGSTGLRFLTRKPGIRKFHLRPAI